MRPIAMRQETPVSSALRTKPRAGKLGEEECSADKAARVKLSLEGTEETSDYSSVLLELSLI